NWETEDQEQNNEPHSPIWNLEERKNLTCDLHEQPCNHSVGDRNLVNVASFQLGQKLRCIHSLSALTKHSPPGRILPCWVRLEKPGELLSSARLTLLHIGGSFLAPGAPAGHPDCRRFLVNPLAALLHS